MGKSFIVISLLVSCLIVSGRTFPQTAEIFFKTGHSDRVNALTVSGGGRFIASGSADNTVKIWDAERGELLRTLIGHEADVFAAAFSPRGEILASASYDGSILLWDFESGDLRQTLRHHQAVTALAFNSDGALLASAGRDSLIKIWDTRDWRLLRELRGHGARIHSISFSSEDNMLASCDHNGELKLWDAANGRLLATLPAHPAPARAVAFSGDNQLLASGGDDRTIKIWRVDTGAPVRTVMGFSGNINAVAFSPEGAILTSASSDKTLKFWDSKTWNLLNSFHNSNEALSLCFSPDGRHLYSSYSDGSLKCWDVKKGSILYDCAAASQNVLHVAFSPDGRWLASAHEDGAVKLWDLREGRRLTTLAEHSTPVNSVTFSFDGRLLASAGSDSCVFIVEVASGRVLHFLKKFSGAVNSLKFSPDGNRLATGGADKIIRIWEVNSGRLLKSLAGHGASINGVDFSPDGQLLASASDDYTVKVWNLAADSLQLNLKGHALLVKSVQFSPNGRWLASASSDNTVRLWDARSGQTLRVLDDHASSVRVAEFHPNGRFLASGGFDNLIRIWEVESGEKIHVLAGHSNDVNSLAFSPEGKLLASAGPDGAIRIWDSDFGELKFCFVNLPENEWLVYHPRKLVYNGSANCENYAAIRFENRLDGSVPLSDFKNELKQKQVLEALFLPQPIIHSRAVRASSSKIGYWLGVAGLSVVGVLLIVWLVKKPEVDSFDLVKRFFSAAGFKKWKRLSEDLFVLSPSNNEPAALICFGGNGAHERIAKAIAKYRRKFSRGVKLYLIYRDRAELLKGQSLNSVLEYSSIPLHISTFVQPSYTSACRQKLRELEKPYRALSDPFYDSEPIHDANWFFGRDELLHRLPNLLAARQHVGVFGLPKVGKTSFIYQLRQVLSNTPSALIDCRTYQLNAEVFFEQILRQLYSQLLVMGIGKLPNKSMLYGRPFPQSLTAMLNIWWDAGRREPFVVMVDGVEQFVNAAFNEAGEKVGVEYQRMFGALREMAERLRDVILVIGSTCARANRLPNIGRGDLSNPLLQFLREEYIGFLSTGESSKMLRELGWRRSIQWRPEACDRVYHHCGGHPWLTRCLASLASRQGERREMEPNHVESAVREIQMNWLNHEIGRYFEQQLVPALSAGEQELLELLGRRAKNGYPRKEVPPQCSSALVDLENFGLIATDVGQISIVGELFKNFYTNKLPA